MQLLLGCFNPLSLNVGLESLVNFMIRYDVTIPRLQFRSLAFDRRKSCHTNTSHGRAAPLVSDDRQSRSLPAIFHKISLFHQCLSIGVGNCGSTTNEYAPLRGLKVMEFVVVSLAAVEVSTTIIACPGFISVCYTALCLSVALHSVLFIDGALVRPTQYRTYRVSTKCSCLIPGGRLFSNSSTASCTR
jgi:hypothetical protein